MGSGNNISDADLSGPVVDRRTTMKLLGAAGMTSLAGCTGGGGDADAERGSLVGLFADADGERHARPDGVLVDNVRPGTIRRVF